jgi:hypothetical protein
MAHPEGNAGLALPLSEVDIGSKLLPRRDELEQPTVDAIARTAPGTPRLAEATGSQIDIEWMSISPFAERDPTIEKGSPHLRNPTACIHIERSGLRLPASRVSLAVMDRDDRDPRSFDAVVDGIRKSPHADVSNGLVDRSMDLRVLLDPIENPLNFGQKFLAQTFPLTLVPVICLVNLVANARLKDEPQTHRGRLT